MIGWLALLVWALAASALHLRGRRQLVRAARAGHEVRGPLCTAQLALEALERSARVEAIGLELRRAALALDDLSGARRRKAVAPVDVGALLMDAAHAWHALARAHGVGLEVEPGGGRVLGDRLRLAQACANLVANAIEHGAAAAHREPVQPRLFEVRGLVPGALFDADMSPAASNGHGAVAQRDEDDRDAALVRVSSSAAGGRVRVEVRDFGPGLPGPVDALVAAARGRRSPRGHGLAIAAAVAERHGGRLASLPTARGARLALELPEAP
jgi:signal transduction histidine kinase